MLTLFKRLGLALPFLLVALTSYADSAATLTQPADRASGIDPRIAFTWTGVPNAERYYLYVGTAVGAKDVIDSGELDGTTYDRGTLQGGTTLYARLWTRFAGHWYYTDRTFSTASLTYLISPADGALNVDTSTMFRWSSVAGDPIYYLYVGTAVGAKDVVDTGEIAATQFRASSLLPGQTLFARLWTKANGAWRYTDSQFQTIPVARFINVTNGQPNYDLATPMQWTAVAGGAVYTLYVGSTVGAFDLLRTGETTATSWSLRSLPGGRLIYLRLWTKANGIWRYIDASVTTAPRALLLNPRPESINYDASIPLTWSTVDSASAYYLYVGSQPGQNDIVNSGETLATTWPGTNVPGGTTVFARLFTRAGGVWKFKDDSFTTRAVAWPRIPIDGTLRTPVSGTIAWNSVATADKYYVYIGSTPGAKDVVDSRELSTTAMSYANLPGNAKLYLRLWTRSGTWRYVDVTFTTQPVVAFTNLASGAVNVATSGLAVNWVPVEGATAYYLRIGTSLGTTELLDSRTIDASITSYVLPELPPGTTIYLRVSSFVGGIWYSSDIIFVTEARARILTPKSNQTGVDVVDVTVAWTPVPTADRYRLQVGSSVGAADLGDYDNLSDSKVRLGPVPGGIPIYLRIWTLASGSWRSSDSHFDGQPMAQLIYPSRGLTGVDTNTEFKWTPVFGATGYQLQIGLTPGSSDLIDSGVIQSVVFIGSDLPRSRTLYARLQTFVQGRTLSFDIAFRTVEGASSPTFLSPASDDAHLDRQVPIEWAIDPLAKSYHLTVGTIPGGSDVDDSGAIMVPFRIVPSMTPGQRLYATLSATYSNGSTLTSARSFIVGQDTLSASDRFGLVERLAGIVRGMAATSNYVFSWTSLYRVVKSEGKVQATCGSYALALLQAIQEANLEVQARLLSVSLNIDGHILIEVYDPNTATWWTTDPTFGFTPLRVSDGMPATSADLSLAMRTQQWSAISYRYLTADQDSVAKAYYMDYPLLFANIFVPGLTGYVQAPLETTLPYYDPLGSSIAGMRAVYVLQCAAGFVAATATVDGTSVTRPCGSADRLTQMFFATTVDLIPGDPSAIAIWKPKRFVF